MTSYTVPGHAQIEKVNLARQLVEIEDLKNDQLLAVAHAYGLEKRRR